MSIERKTHEFGNPRDLNFVRVETVEDPRAKEFGARTWVAAKILASHLHRHWHARYRRGDPTDETRVLELGAGTSLPGLVLAELGACVVLTDTIEEGCVLGNVHAIVKAYDENKSARDEREWRRDERFRAKPPSLTHRHLHWGRLDAEAVALAKTGFDVVVGADVLYGKSRDFDALFATARLLLENAPRENAPGVFVTAYQHRASHRSIESSLATYGLVVRRAFRYPAEGGVTVDVVEITLADA